jgi:hypothetical protein
MGVGGRVKLMGRASTCIALCALIGACMMTSATVPDAHAASATPEAHGSRSPQRGHKQREPTIRLKPIGTSYTPVYTDGVRWAVYEPTEGVTRVMDTVKGTSTTHPDPEGCAGGLIAIGGGEMLYDCSDPECPKAADVCLLMKPEIVCPPVAAGTTCHTDMVPTGYETGRWVVEDIASGAQHLLNVGKGLPTFSQRDVENESQLSAIGSQWARSGSYFVNWHTGQVIYEDKEPASADRDYEDLNSEALLVPLCAPFARRLEPVGPGLERSRYQPLSYELPFMVESRLIGLRSYQYLRRCGSTRVEPLQKESGVLGGLLFFRQERLARLHPHGRPWLGRSYRIAGPSRQPFASIVGVTSTMVVETVARRETASEPASPQSGAPHERGERLMKVWAGRLPWTNATRPHSSGAEEVKAGSIDQGKAS